MSLGLVADIGGTNVRFALTDVDAERVSFDSARKWLTVTLCAICWFVFLVGHVLNNTRGFAS